MSDLVNRDALIDAAIDEYLRAADAGTPPDRDKFLSKYPDLAASLTEFLDDHLRMRDAVRPAAESATITAGPVPSPDATVGLEQPQPAPLVTVRYFGDYELLSEIARGGMGVVYKARQVSLNRVVALKMILAGQLASRTDIERFRQEAVAAGGLDHPNILPIYEVGEHDGQQYFSMKLVEGGSLADLLKECPKTDVRGLVSLLEQVARGVHYAHQRGVLHRDLKPSNVLLDGRDTPVITDFGLAKRTEGDSSLTQSGAIVGTPSYMAPEQARGEKGITTAADIYSLGAILYELLTGQPPFRGESVAQTLRMVEEREPTPPSRVDPTADRDLEAVALKCLEKEPARRYETAGGLTDDLTRWLRGEPVAARRAGTARRAWKWVKRYPVVTALSTAVVLALVAGSITSAVYATQADRRAKESAANEREARRQELKVKNREEVLLDILCVTNYQQARAVRLAGEPGWRSWALKLLKNAAEARQRPRNPDNPDDKMVPLPDLADIRGEAVMALMRRDVTLVRELPGVGDFPKLSMDGSRVLDVSIQIASRRTTFLIHDLVAGKDLARHAFSLRTPDPSDLDATNFVHAALNQDGTRVASGAFPEIRLYELPSLKEVGRLIDPAPHPASESERLRTECCFSPDGSRLLAKRVIGTEVRLLLWAIDKPDRPMEIFRRPTEAKDERGEDWVGLFSPDSKRVAHPTAGDTAVRVIDISKDPPLEVTMVPVPRSRVVSWHPSASILAVLFEDDGRSTFRVALCDLKAPEEIVRSREEFGGNVSLAFNPTGEYLAVGSGDGCHLLGGRDLVERFRVQESGRAYLGRVGWTPLGDLLTAARSDSIRVWRIAQDVPARALYRIGNLNATTYSPDGRWLAGRLSSARSTRLPGREAMKPTLWGLIREKIEKNRSEIVIVDRRTGEIVRSLRNLSQDIFAMQFSPDGTHLAYFGPQGIAVWDLTLGKQIAQHSRSEMKPRFPSDITWDTNGRLLALAAALGENSVLLWDVEVDKPVLSKSTVGGDNPDAIVPHLSQDGRWLVAHFVSRWLPNGDEAPPLYRVFDLHNRRAVGEFSLREDLRRDALWVAISPDGRRFLTMSYAQDPDPGKVLEPGAFELRSLQDGAVLARQPNARHEFDTESWPFSPDGKYVLLHGEAGQALLLDAGTGEVLIRWRPAGDRGPGLLRFTPDGWIAAGGLDDETLTFLNLEEVRKRLTEMGLGW